MLVSKKTSEIHPGRRGSVLIEFALIALVLYLILAATIEFGRALFGAQILQQAADTAAREIARTPGLPVATATLQDVLYNNSDNTYSVARQTIFDEHLLQIKYSDIINPIGKEPLVTYFNGKPIVNQLLFPLMIMGTDSQGDAVLQYPGILPAANPVPNGPMFNVAVVSSYAGGSEGTITYVPVIQEILPASDPAYQDPTNPDNSPFSLTAKNVPVTQRGVVALRINYPFQAATLSATAANPAASSLPRTSTTSRSRPPRSGRMWRRHPGTRPRRRRRTRARTGWAFSLPSARTSARSAA